MENSTIRKVKIIVSGKDGLLALLDELIMAGGEITIEANLKETKQNFSILSNSPHIIDWDFTAESKNELKIKSDIPESEDKKPKGMLKNIMTWDWNGLAWMIEAVWRSAQKSPAVLFQSSFFWRVYDECYARKITPEHSILTKLGEARYHGWKWEEIDEDITKILNIEWKNGIKDKSLSEFSRIIYGER